MHLFVCIEYNHLILINIRGCWSWLFIQGWFFAVYLFHRNKRKCSRNGQRATDPNSYSA